MTPNPETPAIRYPAREYYDWLRARKVDLFALYSGETLQQKIVPQGHGWTWGYRLLFDGRAATGSSIGEDEIRFLLDLPHVTNSHSALCIGVAFGLSCCALALSRPEQQVFGIDNYSERAGQGTDHARNLVQRLAREKLRNLHLHIGTSPGDTAACLAGLSRGESLGIVFIDGLHTDEAAAADFDGVRPYISSKTVVLWHDVFATERAFADRFPSELFDRRLVLHTYGVMGVYFSATEHPALESYLADNCLLWDDWRSNFKRITEPVVRPSPASAGFELSLREKQLVRWLRLLRGCQRPLR